MYIKHLEALRHRCQNSLGIYWRELENYCSAWFLKVYYENVKTTQPAPTAIESWTKRLTIVKPHRGSEWKGEGNTKSFLEPYRYSHSCCLLPGYPLGRFLIKMQIYPCQFLKFKTQFQSCPITSPSPQSSAWHTRLLKVTPPVLTLQGQGLFLVSWYRLLSLHLNRPCRWPSFGHMARRCPELGTRPMSKIVQNLKTPPKCDFSKLLPDLTTFSAQLLNISCTSLYDCWLLKPHLQVRGKISLVLSTAIIWSTPPRLKNPWGVELHLTRPSRAQHTGYFLVVTKPSKEHFRSKQTDNSWIFRIPIMWSYC